MRRQTTPLAYRRGPTQPQEIPPPPQVAPATPGPVTVFGRSRGSSKMWKCAQLPKAGTVLGRLVAVVSGGYRKYLVPPWDPGAAGLKCRDAPYLY